MVFRFRHALAALLALPLAACIPAAAPPAGMPPTTKVVTYDMGGNFAARLRSMDRLRADQTPVAITGSCASACTFFLDLPRSCVTPDALLMFHGPQKEEDDGRVVDLHPDDFAVYSKMVADHYPPRLRAWFMVHAVHKTGRDMATLTGAQAVALGARPCQM